MKKIFFISITLLFFFISSPAFAARLYLFPQLAEIYKGDSFIAEVRLDTEGETINVIDTQINFTPGILEVLEFNTGGGIFSLFSAGPDITSSAIRLQGAAPFGFNGNGLLGTINFRASSIGEAIVGFHNESKILLHDGKGTPTEVTLQNAQYRVIDRPQGLVEITSKDFQDENKWYNHPAARMNWPHKEGATYSYIVTRNPFEEPDEIADEPQENLKLIIEDNGIFYFRLRECINGVCGPTATYKILKDTEQPEPFDIFIARDASIFEGKKFLSFSTTDSISGIDYYEVNEGTGWKGTESPYVLENQDFLGSRKVGVRAVDRANNMVEAELVLPGLISTYKIYLLFAIIIVALILIMIYWYWRKKSHTALPADRQT